MLNKLWGLMIVAGICVAAFTGRIGTVSTSVNRFRKGSCHAVYNNDGDNGFVDRNNEYCKKGRDY